MGANQNVVRVLSLWKTDIEWEETDEHKMENDAVDHRRSGHCWLFSNVKQQSGSVPYTAAI